MIEEHESVVVTRNLPEVGLHAGDIGTVVHIYGDRQGYELEIFAANGDTIDVVTVPGDAVREARHDDMRTVRAWAAE